MKYSPELGNNSLGVHIKYCDELILVLLVLIHVVMFIVLLCFCPVPTAGATQYKEDIAWSSSDSQQSEDEDQQRRLSRAATWQQQHQQQRRGQRPRTLAASVHPSRPHPGHASETGEWKYER